MADGTAHAVWADARNSGQFDIYFASIAAGASAWTTNTKVSDDPGSAAQLDPDIGIDSSGNLAAVWRDERVAPASIRAARRPSGGAWSASVSLGGSDAAFPRLAVRADGRAYAAWQGSAISGAEYNATTGSWLASETVVPGSESGQRPAVAINSAQLVVVYASPVANSDI